MQLPGLVQFRKCTLTDKHLAESVAAGLTKMYKEPVTVPSRHIPARPDEDFDLLVGEIVVRFLEKTDARNNESSLLMSEKKRLQEFLEKINNIMWTSYMVKDKGIADKDCSEIMEVLNNWAEFDS